MTNQIFCNGIPYNIVAEDRDGLCIRRPKGVKEYFARRLPDSPLYGEQRAQIICAFSYRQGSHPGGQGA